MGSCEFCGGNVICLQVLVNGREYHHKCRDAVTPDQWREEVDLAMALPNPNDPNYRNLMRKIDTYAFKNKLGVYGERSLTPFEIRKAFAE